LVSTEQSSRALRVVAIGGGTGLSTILRGLKRYAALPGESVSPAAASPDIAELCAVVTVSDDGGSSGRLRKELNMLPPGDIRNCIVALSEDEALLSRLFQHRFSKGGLEGHNFGNLFLAALTSITEDFGEAVRLSSEILLTRGHIYPATTANVELEALMEDGTRVRGETTSPPVRAGSRNFFWILRCRAAAANAGSYCPRRSHHHRAGIALHQLDSEPSGARHSARNREFVCSKSVCLQFDDSGQ